MTVPEETSETGGIGTSPSGYWRDDSVHFGVFAYRSHIGVNADLYDRIGGMPGSIIRTFLWPADTYTAAMTRPKRIRISGLAKQSILFFHGWCRTSGMRTFP